MTTPDTAFVHTNSAGTILAHSAGLLPINRASGFRTLAATRQLFEQLFQPLHRHQGGRILINQMVMVPFTPAG